MTSVNNAMGVASDSLLRVVGTMSRPSGWSSRELRREAQRAAKREAKKKGRASDTAFAQRPALR